MYGKILDGLGKKTWSFRIDLSNLFAYIRGIEELVASAVDT